MHEYGIVQELIGAVTREARARHATSVGRLQVAIGELSGVEPELLVLAWQTFRERTVCEGAELSLRKVPAVWRCPLCERDLEPGQRLQCPTCGAPARLHSGDDLVLERIEMEVPDV